MHVKAGPYDCKMLGDELIIYSQNGSERLQFNMKHIESVIGGLRYARDEYVGGIVSQFPEYFRDKQRSNNGV